MYNKRIFSVLFFFIFLSNLAQSANHDKEIAKLNYYKERLQTIELNYIELISTYDSIINISNRLNLTKENINYQLKKVDLLASYGYYFEANQTAKNILILINKTPNTKEVLKTQKLETLLAITLNNYKLGMLDVATQYVMELLKLNNKENQNYEARAYSILASILDSYNLDKESKDKHQEALHLLIKNNKIENYTYYVIYSNYAGWFYKDQQYDSALFYLNLSDKYIDSGRDNIEQHISNLQNKAIIYQALNENTIAEECFLRALALPSFNRTNRSKVLCQENLAYLYFEQNQFEKALYHFKQALLSAEKNYIEDLVGTIQTEMAQVFYAKGEYKVAFDLYQKGKIKNETIFNLKNTQKIIEYKNQYETQKLKSTLEINSLKAKNRNILLGILSFLLIISFSIILISIRKLYGRNKENKQLNLSLEIQAKEKEEEIELSQHTFSQTLQMKNMELTSHAMVLAKLKDCMDSIQVEVDHLVNEPNLEERKNIAKSIKTILNFNKTEKNWNEFRLYFEQTHPAFFKKLNDTYPDLSINEQRLCALLSLNMRIKEIAELTNRSTRSIETFVYRIRKKLQIPAEVKTHLYFKDFLES